jgi:hypothetical protein
MNTMTRNLGRVGGLAVLLVALAAFAAAPVSAQQASVYAVATLTAEGQDPHTSTSTATLEETATGGTRVTVIMMGLEPNSRHANHVHDGNCIGEILYPLQLLEADASGMARAVTELDVKVEPVRSYVTVHAGDTLPSPMIACGQVNVAIAGGTPPVSPPVGGGPEETVGMPRAGYSGGFGAAPLLATASALAILLGLGLRLSRRGAFDSSR